jgi:7 transmembrane receptor (rhodopsin family).
MIVNVKSFLELKRRAYPILDKNDRTSDSNKCSPANKKASVVTLIILTFVYVATSLPLFVFWSYNLVNLPSNLLHYSFLEFSMSVWLLNASINPTVYILRTKRLRNYYHQFFTAKAQLKQPPNTHADERECCL